MRDRNRKREKKNIDGTQKGLDVITLYCPIPTCGMRGTVIRNVAADGRLLIDTLQSHRPVGVQMMGYDMGHKDCFFMVLNYVN